MAGKVSYVPHTTSSPRPRVCACGSLKLTLIGYGFTEEVTLGNAIETAALLHQQWSRSSLDPHP